MFYNGANLLLDVVLVTVAVLLAHGKGYRRAKRVTLERFRNSYTPPF